MAKSSVRFFAFSFVSFFISFFIVFLFPGYVYATGIQPKILTKEDLNGFEKMTFYNTENINIIGTDPEGVDIQPSDTYGFMKKHRLVSTERGVVKANYGHIGQYHGRDISVDITFSDFKRKTDSTFGERDGRSICIPLCFRDNFQYDGDSLVQKMVFYYSDDKARTAIDMTNAFIVINGLNVDEYAGMEPDHQVYLSENSQLKEKEEGSYICYGNGPQGKSDTCVTGKDDIKYELNGKYYEEDLTNPLYYICSAMFTLNGTDNSLYIEDRRKAGGYGIEWSLDLTTLHITYNIKTKVENGTITEDVSNILYNSDQTIEYSPSENYILDSVSVDGTPIDKNDCPDRYDFKNITQDHEISVVYKLPYKKVNTIVENGNITPPDDHILFDTDKTVEYSPDEGYILDTISVDNIPQNIEKNPNRFSFLKIREDHEIEVKYTKPDAPIKKVLDKNREFINGKSVIAGDTLTYEITFKNNLDRKADISISDSIPRFTEFESIFDGGVLDDGKVVWNFSANPSEERTVSFSVRVLPEAKGNNISNYAMESIEGISLMSNIVNNPVQGDPIKKVKNTAGKEINGTFIEKGEEVVYSISVRNPSADSKKLQIWDDIPEGMDYISADNNGVLTGKTVSWDMMIKPGEEKEVSFKVRVREEGTRFTNMARVVIDGMEIRTNKVENWSVLPPKKEVKQNGISAENKDITNGESVNYYISVKNTSDKKADIRVEDRIPEHLEVISVDNGAVVENGVITWLLKNVSAGETKIVSFTAKVNGEKEPTKITNTAYMTIGSKRLSSNEVTINVPAVRTIEVLGEVMKPLLKENRTADSKVLGEKKIPTGDRQNILVLILIAMCALAGIVFVKIRER